LLEFMVTVVFMALALATLPVQLFQVLQLALNEAFTVSTVFCGILVKVFVVPAETVPLALTWPLTVTLQQLVVWFTVRLYVGVPQLHPSTAASMSSKPYPFVGLYAPPLLAVDSSRLLKAVGLPLRQGHASSNKAAAPAAWGQAMLVPCITK